MSQSRFSCGYDSDSSDDYGDYSDQDCSQGIYQGSRRFGSRGKWTKEEDDKLRNAVEYHGCSDWTVIAGYVDRNELQCIQRWQKVLNPDLVKGPWTKEEDDLVVTLVDEFGPKRWSLISKYLTGRTGKQCRERWHNHLNPNIKKSAWTIEEDRIIYEAHKRLGNKWAEIAKLIPGRTDNAIKNHWNSTMKRKAESSSNPYSPRNQLACAYRYGQASTTYPMYVNNSNAAISTVQQSNYQEGSLRSILHTNIRRSTLPSTSSQLSGVMNAQGSPMRWIVMDNEGIISPFRDLPEIADTNFLEQDPRLDDLSTFDMLLGDESHGTTPIKFTKLHQKGSTGYRFDGHAISKLSKDSSGILIPITSPVTSKYSTPPTILRKKRRRSHLDTSRKSSNSSLLKTPDVKQHCKDTSTPKTTPIKPLTFSPSQFFNLHSPMGIGLTPGKQQLTSTPISKVEPSTSLLSTPQFLTQTPSNKENVPDGFFRTPKIRRALLETPRTPTPLKDALAALEKKGGAIRRLPQTPDHLVEDLSEIIKKDEELSGLKAISSPLKRKQKESDTPTKRVRKTLSSQWADEKKNTDDYFFSMPGTAETPSSQYPNSDSNAIIRQLFRDSASLLSDDANMDSYSFPSLEHFGSDPALLSHVLPPTNTHQCAVPSNMPDFDHIDPQSSSLLAESSLLTSPDRPSKDLLNSSDSFSVTLDQGFIAPAAQTSMSKYRSNKSLKDFKRFNETPFKHSIKLNKAWEAVACGQTADQLILIQQAKKYLFSSIKPRSLKL